VIRKESEWPAAGGKRNFILQIQVQITQSVFLTNRELVTRKYIIEHKHEVEPKTVGMLCSSAFEKSPSFPSIGIQMMVG